MSTRHPHVTVVVPTLDEGDRIDACLAAVLAQTWPADRLQVLVIDSGSTDQTVARARGALAGRADGGSGVVENPGAGRAANLNRGLAAAVGGVLCRVDARSLVPPDYVARCVELLEDPSRAVVGGSQRTVAGGAGAQARGVARALDNRFAMGMARYRRGGPSGPADTVYLGAFRTEQVRAVGGWDESLDVNEDFDLNTRLRDLGCVWYAAELPVGYVARDRVVEVARQYWGFGAWKVRYLRSRRARPRPRQVVGLAIAPLLAGGAWALAVAPPPWRRRALILGAVVVGSGEHLGATGRAPSSTRLWSVLACATLVTSWSAGAWAELLLGPMTGRRRRG